MDGKYGTKFQETEALLAQANDDKDTVYEILNAASKAELHKFAEDLEELAANARFVAGKK